MRKRLILFLPLLLLSSVPRESRAQASENDRRSPGPGPVVVTLDLRTGAIGSPLPFDEPFILKAEDKSNEVAGVALSIFEADEPFEVVRCGKTRNPQCGQGIDEGWKCVETEPQKHKAGAHPRRTGPTRGYPEVQCTFLHDVAWSLPPLQPKKDAAADFVLHVPALEADSHHQFLVLYRLNNRTPEENGLLAKFEDQAAKVIAARYAGIDPQNAPYGSFALFQEALLEELVTLARDRGLEVIDDADHPLLRWSDRGLTADGRSPQEALEETFNEVAASGASLLVSAHLRLSSILRPECRSEFGELRQATARLEAIRASDALGPALRNTLRATRVRSFLEESLSIPCETSDPAEVEATATSLKELITALEVAGKQAGEIPGGEDLRKALKDVVGAASKLDNTVSRMARDLRTIEEGARRLAKSFSAFVAQTTLFARASTIGTFETRAKWQISGDFGVAWAPEVDEALPFLGTNFYTRPVNKQASLQRNPFGQPRRRLSFAIGLVLTDLGDDRTREALFDTGKFSVLLGGGWRVTDSIRLGAGAVVFKEMDPDPLVDDTSITSSPYVSLALDWDLKSLVQWMQRLWPNS